MQHLRSSSYDEQEDGPEDCRVSHGNPASEVAAEVVEGETVMSSPHFTDQSIPTTTPAPIPQVASPNDVVSISQLLRPGPDSPDRATVSWASPTIRQSGVKCNLSSEEAYFVHHFVTHLGRWLDCTDASRKFSLKIPALVTASPILLEAVVSFAARHMGDTEAADAAYDRCIGMLIVTLGSDHICNDDVLLCAIVILRVFEQLTGKRGSGPYNPEGTKTLLLTGATAVATGSDHERHLAGCSALLRASQGSALDLSAPTLREAAFWVYMRQCLYNACIHQQPPNVDFSLTTLPIPAPTSSDPIGDLRSETSWANLMTWVCAMTGQFCFGGAVSVSLEQSDRVARWRELMDRVDCWEKERPDSFNPIWEDEGSRSRDGNPFPDVLFVADWHGMFSLLQYEMVGEGLGTNRQSHRIWLLSPSSYPAYHLQANSPLRDPESPLQQA